MKYTPPTRHPIIQKMLDAWNALPDDWPEAEAEKYCLSHTVTEEIEAMGKVKFTAFIFTETKSNLGHRLLFSSPLLLDSLSYSDLIAILLEIQQDDLACSHYVPIVYNDFGIDVSKFYELTKYGAALRYCCVAFSDLDIKLKLEQIPQARIDKLRAEGAPILEPKE
jgi:hypothetical protein